MRSYGVVDEYIPRYYAVIEREDGSTYTQPFDDFEDLIELRNTLGDEYMIVEIY